MIHAGRAKRLKEGRALSKKTINQIEKLGQCGPRSWRKQGTPEASETPSTATTTTATNTLGQTRDGPRPGFAQRGPRNRNNTAVEPTREGI